jgi:hypothetical protein
LDGQQSFETNMSGFLMNAAMRVSKPTTQNPMPEKTPKQELKIEVKNVKHVFTPEELNEIGGNLARSIAAARGIESEFDQVKASYKAKTTEAEARIDNLSTARMNGFDMRSERCVVFFRPTDSKKDYWLESDARIIPNGNRVDLGLVALGKLPVLTEDMTRDDFQADLLQAESKFDLREEIELFKPAEGDQGILVVGRFGGKWFSALRVRIGKLQLEERLDSEQKAFKLRPDAISTAVKRVNEWARANLKDLAAGFQASFNAVAESHKERAE